MPWEYQNLDQPLRVDLKYSIETRLAALFTDPRVAALAVYPILTPAKADFPEYFTKTSSPEAETLSKVCARFGANPKDYQILSEEELYDSEKDEYRDPPTYPIPIIIYSELARDPSVIICWIVNAVVRGMLQKDGVEESENMELYRARHEDRELVGCVAGFGIFLANTSIVSMREYGSERGFSMREESVSPYPPAAYGYILALLYFGEEGGFPAWAAHLRDDVRASFRNGFEYLRKTKDTIFHPRILRIAPEPLDAARARRALENGSPAVVFDALLQISSRKLDARAFIQRIAAFLEHDDEYLAARAAETLADVGPPAEEALECLFSQIGKREAAFRESAARAIGNIRARPRNSVDILAPIPKPLPSPDPTIHPRQLRYNSSEYCYGICLRNCALSARRIVVSARSEGFGIGSKTSDPRFAGSARSVFSRDG